VTKKVVGVFVRFAASFSNSSVYINDSVVDFCFSANIVNSGRE
jgi:hypothetical protein